MGLYPSAGSFVPCISRTRIGMITDTFPRTDRKVSVITDGAATSPDVAAGPDIRRREYPSCRGMSRICAARAQMIIMRMGVAGGSHAGVHHQAGAGRDVRHGGIDPLACVRRWNGDTRIWRQRL